MTMEIQTKSIINNLTQATVTCEGFWEKAIAPNPDLAIQRAMERLLGQLNQALILVDYFELVPENQLSVFKESIAVLGGLADHYFLSETPGLSNSLGWGPKGIELRGQVKITQTQVTRVQQFVETARYNIALHNCEHFANYILHGLPLSSQQTTWHKGLGATVIAQLQPKQTITENILADINRQFKHRLQVERAKRAKQEIYQFCQAHQIELEPEAIA
ncbi:hypothetical protein FEK30_02870 [Picosynechococcus sp. PCC 11901]|uniref:hypothetical protein n=2 Tax=Picosynechococcus sp. PCC 11901 TaxID=2579791 RepID=UPI0010FBFEF4|nr:hypothetical protein FEK30_02870 [Picosynechococcus sp. PCC 11901]